MALLVFLILTQQALQSGLITSFVGAIERQSAPVLVYSVDGQRTLQGSVITPDLEKRIAAVPGVGATGAIGQGTFTVSVDGGESSDAALIGYRRPDLGAPDALSAGRTPSAAGEAVGSAGDFSLGDLVAVQGARGRRSSAARGRSGQRRADPGDAHPLRRWSDYAAATRAANPDASAILPSAIGVSPAAGVTPAELATRINDASADADALTRSQAADASPGVSQVKQSFQLIFLLFALVVPLVTGLFFLIITLQKSRSLTLLRAIGAPASVLVRSLLVQVLIIIGGGIVLGTLLFVPLTQATLGSLSLSFDPRAVLLWAALLLILGLVSAVAAARRVLAIDPIEATTGGGAR